MKYIFVLLIFGFLLTNHKSFSQSVAINTDGSVANTSAILDLKSSAKGLLIPRMNSTQRSGISSPAIGLLVFDTDSNSFWFFDGSAWTEISIGGKGWSLKGNSGTDTSINAIGTNDNMPLIFKMKNIRSGIIDSNSNNTALGFSTLNKNIYTTGQSNTAFGYKNLFSNSTGIFNTAIGANSLINNTTGNYNTAIGSLAMTANTTGNDNVVVGDYALSNNTTGYSNSAFGSAAMQLNTTGHHNTSVGKWSLLYDTSGYENTAIGASSLFSNTNGFYNTATGSNALYYNTTGIQNTAIGEASLFKNTTADYNTAVGSLTLENNTSGTQNTAIGAGALHLNIIGYNNTATGVSSLENTTTSNNTATGAFSLLANNTGTQNTAAGAYSLYYNNSGSYNTAMGYLALAFNSSGDHNIAIGDSSLFYNTTGSKNIAIGFQSGVDPVTPGLTNTISIGNNGWLNAASNQAFIGNASTAWIGGWAGWSIYSDGRIKNQISEDVKGLDFIKRLRPVTYHKSINAATQLTGNKSTDDYLQKFDAEKINYSGFIAQEVEKAAKESGYDFSGVTKPKGAKDLYSLDYSSFVVPLVKAVQEQQAMIDKQNKIIETQSKLIKELFNRIVTLEQKSKSSSK